MYDYGSFINISVMDLDESGYGQVQNDSGIKNIFDTKLYSLGTC
jgi:hypothetical protein